MKKLLLALGVATALTGTAFANTDVVSQDSKIEGRVTLLGKIVPETCEVAQESKELTVELPTLSVYSFEGQDRGRKDFKIKLVKCDGGHSKISLGFKPIAGDVDGNGLLLNKASTEAAGGVKLQLSSNDKPIQLHKAVGEQGVPEIAETYNPDERDEEAKFEYEFDFSAEYVKASDATVTPGNVRANLPFSIIYK